MCICSVWSHSILGQVHVEGRSREMFEVKLQVFWLDSRSQASALLSTGRCPAEGRCAVGESSSFFCLVSYSVSSSANTILHMHAWQVGVNPYTWRHCLHLHVHLQHSLIKTWFPSTFRCMISFCRLLEDWTVDVRESKLNSETSAFTRPWYVHIQQGLAAYLNRALLFTLIVKHVFDRLVRCGPTVFAIRLPTIASHVFRLLAHAEAPDPLAPAPSKSRISTVCLSLSSRIAVKWTMLPEC